MKLSRLDLSGKSIDAHAHAGVSLNFYFDNKYPYCYSLLDIERYLKESSFDAACVFPFPSYICGNSIPIKRQSTIDTLKHVFEEVPYRIAMSKMLIEMERFQITNILPFNMFSINYAVEEQIAYLNSIRDRIYGLKYYPDADARLINELSATGRPFLDFLIENNMPLTIHVSENACLFGHGYSNVMDAVNLARSLPKLRIAVAHMGHFCYDALQKAHSLSLPNLFFDVSPLLHICHIRTVNSGNVLALDYSKPYQVLKELLNLFPNNLLWGSDIPFHFTCNLDNPNHNVDYTYFSITCNLEQLEKLKEEEIKRICNLNTLDYLFGAE